MVARVGLVAFLVAFLVVCPDLVAERLARNPVPAPSVQLYLPGYLQVVLEILHSVAYR